jgi:uncharacterized protein YbjQ (UPF0145 family)
MYEASRKAIARMTAECAALGGHGVVGVRLTTVAVPTDGQDGQPGQELVGFNAIGTAVRAPGSPPLSTPFTSNLSGQDFAKLITRGSVPVGMVLGIAVGVRHDDLTTFDETGRYTGNTEIGGHTHLVSATRHDARRELAQDVRRLGAEGVVVTSMRLRARERPCPASAGARDHVVEATTTGTAITRFSQAAETTGAVGLAIMRLGPRQGQSRDVTFGLGHRSEKMR